MYFKNILILQQLKVLLLLLLLLFSPELTCNQFAKMGLAYFAGFNQLTIWPKATLPKLNFAKIVKILMFIHKLVVSVHAKRILIFHGKSPMTLNKTENYLICSFVTKSYLLLELMDSGEQEFTFSRPLGNVAR